MVAIDNSTIRAKTLDRFEQSELARAKALELGKSRKEAHEAAKTIWNDWAEEALAERKALEKAGHWPDSSLSFHELGDRNGKFESWAERYSTSFFSCTFSTKKPNFAEETRDIKNNDIDSPLDVRSLRLQKKNEKY